MILGLKELEAFLLDKEEQGYIVSIALNGCSFLEYKLLDQQGNRVYGNTVQIKKGDGEWRDAAKRLAERYKQPLFKMYFS